MRTLDNIFKQETRYKALFLSLLLCAIGSGLHKGILDNYVAEMAHMNELDRGIMEFFREVPGLLLVLILALFIYSTGEHIQIGMRNSAYAATINNFQTT